MTSIFALRQSRRKDSRPWEDSEEPMKGSSTEMSKHWIKKLNWYFPIKRVLLHLKSIKSKTYSTSKCFENTFVNFTTDWVGGELDWGSKHLAEDYFDFCFVLFFSSSNLRNTRLNKSEFKVGLFTWWFTHLNIRCVTISLCSIKCWQKGSDFNACFQPFSIKGCIIYTLRNGLLWFTTFGGSSG